MFVTVILVIAAGEFVDTLVSHNRLNTALAIGLNGASGIVLQVDDQRDSSNDYA